MTDASRPRLPAPIVTFVLIALNVAAFAVEVALGADAMQPSTWKLTDLGGNLSALTLDGEWWRLATAMFLHGGALHLLMNMYALWAGGPLAERMYGRAGYLALYLFAGLASGLASAARARGVPSVGASGAIFGVFGAVGAWLLVHRRHIEPAALRAVAGNLGVFIVLNLAIGASVAAIDNAAHVGGLVGGFAFGLALEWGRREARSLARLAIAVVLGAGALAGVTAALKPPPRGLLSAPATNRAVYAEFDNVQRTAGAEFNQLLAASHQGKMSDAELAGIMDRDVLPPWRKLKARLDALPAPRGIEAFHHALVEYVDARLTALVAIAELAHGRGADPAHVKELQERANAAFDRLDGEIAKLR